MKIQSSEKVIVGGFDNNDRITSLIKTHLTKIKSNVNSWTTLYQDPGDKRYWELYYPQSELHGGGPASIRNLSVAEAYTIYGL